MGPPAIRDNDGGGAVSVGYGFHFINESAGATPETNAPLKSALLIKYCSLGERGFNGLVEILIVNLHPFR